MRKYLTNWGNWPQHMLDPLKAQGPHTEARKAERSCLEDTQQNEQQCQLFSSAFEMPIFDPEIVGNALS